jgi:hypothetical protein
MLGAGEIYVFFPILAKPQLLHEQSGLIGAVKRIRQQRQPLHIQFLFGETKGLERQWTRFEATAFGRNSRKNDTPPYGDPGDIPQPNAFCIA